MHKSDSSRRQPLIQFGILTILVLRVILLFLPSFKIDMNTWQAWTGRLADVGPLHFYAPNYFTDYFPGYLYVLWILGSFLKLIGQPQAIFTDQFAILLKIVTTLFDFATAYLLIKIVAYYRSKTSYAIGILYLLNPAVIFNSAIWGQVDGVLTFAMVLSCYLFLCTKKQNLFSIASAWAVITKPQAVVMLPVLTVANLFQAGLSKTMTSCLVIATAFFTIGAPFFLSNPIVGPIKLLNSATSVYPYTSLYALNFWTIIGWWQNDLQKFWQITYQMWGYGLFALFMLLILGIYVAHRDKKSGRLVLFVVALSILTFYLFPTRIHERYLLPFFAFLLVSAWLYRSVVLWLVYALLSVIHFLNLWFVYFYYNVLYNNPNPPANSLYTFIDSYHVQLAFVTLACYGIMLAMLWRFRYEKS